MAVLNRALAFLANCPAANDASGNCHLLTAYILALLAGDALLTLVIVAKVPYTEIDWEAYMSQVEGFLGGERDYRELRGGTGPCVYPGFFLYIFSALHRATRSGTDIRAAQLIFAALYLLSVGAALALYRRAGGGNGPGNTPQEISQEHSVPGGAAPRRGEGAVPTAALALLCASRRLHSIYVLRLFNDSVAVALFLAAALAFSGRRWAGGCVLYSLAVGVKMSVLLAAPGLALLLLQAHGPWGAAAHIALCAAVQAVVGSPFLLAHPVAYVLKAFEFGRVFEHRYTVNLKFLPENVFVSRALSAALLVGTAAAMAAFGVKWARAAAVSARRCQGPRLLSPVYIVRTLFASNFIGMVFCRSVHYQFYSWYYFSLPLLLWSTRLPTVARLAVLAATELAYNVYPATPASSALLQAAHITLLAALWFAPVPPAWLSTAPKWE